MLEEKCSRRIDSVSIIVLKGDITRVTVDAIVNPANSYMVMGGGVAYAIKRAGGRVIEEEALKYMPVPVGKAAAIGDNKHFGGRVEADLHEDFVIPRPTVYVDGKLIIDKGKHLIA